MVSIQFSDIFSFPGLTLMPISHKLTGLKNNWFVWSRKLSLALLLKFLSKGPFDRVLVAQATVEGITLLTVVSGLVSGWYIRNGLFHVHSLAREREV